MPIQRLHPPLGMRQWKWAGQKAQPAHSLIPEQTTAPPRLGLSRVCPVARQQPCGLATWTVWQRL